MFDHLSLNVYRGERIGLVGANGVGKSTLLKIITGQIEPDGGAVLFGPQVEWGYVAQKLEAPEGQTIEEVLWAAQRTLRAMQARSAGTTGDAR